MEVGATGRRGGGDARGSRRRRLRVRESEENEKIRRRRGRDLLSFTSLPSARDLALGKDFFNLKIFFTECPVTGTRQRSLCRVPSNKHSTKVCFRVFENSLPSVSRLTLGKAYLSSVIPWALDKVYIYIFYFGNQTFCGMFLHYVDLHVPFWDNYKSVFYNY
jgi:hypothetical protein